MFFSVGVVFQNPSADFEKILVKITNFQNFEIFARITSMGSKLTQNKFLSSRKTIEHKNVFQKIGLLGSMFKDS